MQCRSLVAIARIVGALSLGAMAVGAQAAPKMVGAWVYGDDATSGITIEENDAMTCLVYDVDLTTGERTGPYVYESENGVFKRSDPWMSIRIAYIVREDLLAFDRCILKTKSNGVYTWIEPERSCWTLRRAGPNAQAEAKAELARRAAQQQGNAQ